MQPPADAQAASLHGFASFDEIRTAINRIDNNQLKGALLPLLEDARTDMTNGVAALTKFNGRVEVWYDQAMDRVSGWYKRRTQMVLFAIAFVSASLLNVDTVNISRTLARDSALRASIVAMAEKHAKSTTAPSSQPAHGESNLAGDIDAVQKSVTQLDSLGVPLGWVNWRMAHPPGPYAPRNDNLWDTFNCTDLFILKLFGILLTAFAASLGAPFWFDVLNKFMSIRASGKAPEERPKDPKKVLQPQAPHV